MCIPTRVHRYARSDTYEYTDSHMHTHAHGHVHTHTHVCMHTHSHAYVCTRHTCIHTCTDTHSREHILLARTHTHTLTHTYTLTRAHTHRCMCLYTYANIHTHPHAHTDGHVTHRLTHTCPKVREPQGEGRLESLALVLLGLHCPWSLTQTLMTPSQPGGGGLTSSPLVPLDLLRAALVFRPAWRMCLNDPSGVLSQ